MESQNILHFVYSGHKFLIGCWEHKSLTQESKRSDFAVIKIWGKSFEVWRYQGDNQNL